VKTTQHPSNNTAMTAVAHYEYLSVGDVAQFLGCWSFAGHDLGLTDG